MKNIPYLIGVVLLLSLMSCNSRQASGIQEAYKLPDEILVLAFGTEVGDRAPEIVLNDQDGNPLKLSTLQGKVVLVDFWASWCAPCRKESPELLRAYTEYNAKSFEVGDGFEIFSVSLDRNETAWKEAIEKDGMTWPYNLGDMLGAKTTAAIDYGVQMIPVNFLLDKNGVIIAKNLFGADLEAKLGELVSQ